jgi:hypothetical protein
VFLAACELAKRTAGYHDAGALPGAFVGAGARAAFAAGTKIPDRGASAFFEALGAELARGKSPAVALRDVRVSFLNRPASAWASDIVAFQP